MSYQVFAMRRQNIRLNDMDLAGLPVVVRARNNSVEKKQKH